jgi:molybdopterin-guanine dinucleotide biosynthesis protein A
MGHAKALLPHPYAQTFVEYVVGVAQRVVPDVVLLGTLDPLPPALRSLPSLPDAEPQRGPLVGLCTALRAVADRWVLLLACDLGWLGPEALLRLLRLATPETDAVAFTQCCNAIVYHTCCALYHPRVLPAAAHELTHGGASLQAVLRAVRVRAIVPDADAAQQLANVNTPVDLANLLTYPPASLQTNETKYEP